MRLDKRTLAASPFVGVFGILTDKILLLPHISLDKERAGLTELTGVEFIEADIAASSLLGVLGVGVKDKIALSELARDEEIDNLKSAGLKVERITGVTALGNMVCITEKGGVVSPILTEEQKKQLESFFGVELVFSKIGETDLTGSSIVSNSKGFIVHPNVTEQEFELIKKALRVEGIPTTANYGDKFVGNSVIANNESAIVGLNSTGHEIIRIEEAFYGQED